MPRLCLPIFIWLISIPVRAQEEFLPIYSNPMVFLNKDGEVAGRLPEDCKLLNTYEGSHSAGWARGMAPNTVRAGYFPTINSKDFRIRLHAADGTVTASFQRQYQSMTPLNNGYYLAQFKQKGKYLEENRYHFINEFGQQVFNPKGYDAADVFSEGSAAVLEDGAWKYINSFGHELPIRPPEIPRMREVSSFREGLSRIKVYSNKCAFYSCWRYLFTNEEGEIIIDTDALFPGKQILHMSSMQNGMSTVKFYADLNAGGNPVAYVTRSGKVVAEEQNLFRTNHFIGDWVAINRAIKEGSTTKVGEVFLLSKTGERMDFPIKHGMKVGAAFHLDATYFLVDYLNEVKGEKGASKIWDASQRSFVHDVKGTVMGLKWSLLSLKNAKTRRYWVVDLKSGETQYDSQPENMVFYNLESALKVKERVTRFVCQDPAELAGLADLPALRELTLEKMKIEALPENFSLDNLETLRIDGLIQLKQLPAQVRGLKKLSLRNCIEVQNLMQMLSGQEDLEMLHLINFGLDALEVNSIKTMFPKAMVEISGSRKNAFSDLQRHYPDF